MKFVDVSLNKMLFVKLLLDANIEYLTYIVSCFVSLTKFKLDFLFKYFNKRLSQPHWCLL